MQLEKKATGYTLVLSKSEADSISDTLLKRAVDCNRTVLDLAYLTSEAVLSMENTFRQPKSFLEVTNAL